MMNQRTQTLLALVIDDSPVDRKVVSELLHSFGVETVEVENGEQAYVTLADEPSVSLVIVDWNMPMLNGIDFTRKICAERRYNHLKIVMITASNEMDEVRIALEAGVHEYIMKPLDREVFRAKLALVGVSVEATEA